MKLVYILCVFLSFTSLSMADRIAKIDDFMNSLMNCSQMTGVSLAIAFEGEIYHTKGYGIKHLDTKEPVTEDTMFVIASITKHMVATAMAKVIQGADGLSWNSKIHDELPHFYFSDPIRTNMTHITDLFTHRTGQGLHNRMRIAGFSIEELMERIRHLGFQSDFRDGFVYNNLMYGLASYIILAREGQPYEDVMKEKIFTPLGMDKATFANRASERWDEFARAFTGIPLREVPMEYFEWYYGTISAPGGVCSNAVDMAKWMNFQLSYGKSSTGEQVVQESLMRDLHTASNVINAPPSISRPGQPYTRSSQRVGKGWNQGFYKGLVHRSHGGSIGGYTSHMSLLPDKQIGIYSAANGPTPVNGWPLLHAYLMDLMMGDDPWVTLEQICPINILEHEVYDEEEENMLLAKEEIFKKITNDAKRRYRREAEEPEPERIGTYGNFAYGNITIFVNDETDKYNMLYGEKAYYELSPIFGFGVYQATGLGPIWQDQHLVTFDGDEVLVTFDLLQPPVFIRGLKQADAPPPPLMCPPAEPEEPEEPEDPEDTETGNANVTTAYISTIFLIQICMMLFSQN